LAFTGWWTSCRRTAPLYRYISFHVVMNLLCCVSASMHFNTASHDLQVLQEYVNLIDDPELKLSVALKYKCHDVIINVS